MREAPIEADFDVQVREGHVEVIFRPTQSHYSFGVLVDPEYIARFVLSLDQRTFDMPRQAIPAITPQARWSYGLPLASAAISNR